VSIEWRLEQWSGIGFACFGSGGRTESATSKFAIFTGKRSGILLVMVDLLRRARVEDLPTIWRGELAYMREIEPQHEARWTAAADHHLTAWIADLDRTLVLDVEDEPAGYAAWRLIEGRAVLLTIHVFEGFRRRGRGALLLQAYVNDARTFGCTDLSLGVFAGNPAEALYVKHGFQYTHEEAGYQHYELRSS
jgi:[ribosomal protein S18]-alanine N-acetyltransferase